MDSAAKVTKAVARIRTWASSVVSGAEIAKLQSQLDQKDQTMAAMATEVEALATELAGPEQPANQQQSSNQPSNTNPSSNQPSKSGG